MCLSEVVGDVYYIDEEEANKEAKKANNHYGDDCGDFWVKTLEKKYTISDLRKDVAIKTAPNHSLREIQERGY